MRERRVAEFSVRLRRGGRISNTLATHGVRLRHGGRGGGVPDV
jgi:hypothetical protein